MNFDEDILILRKTNGLVSFKIPVEAAALYVRLDPPVSVQCSSVPWVTSIKPNRQPGREQGTDWRGSRLAFVDM